MSNLAGFDLIIEIARMAIERELLNIPFASSPHGPANDTLAPPFMFAREIPLGGANGYLNLKVTELTLVAQPATSQMTLKIAFQQGSMEILGAAVAMIAGWGTISAPLYFTPPAHRDGSHKPLSDLALDLNQANTSIQLDPDSNARMDQALGGDMAAAARIALSGALTAMFKSFGLIYLGFSLAVDPHQDSDSMLVLTAPPLLSWIDAETLGIFGYYRRGAAGGNPALKTRSDLPPAPYPGYPMDDLAVLISAAGFQQIVAGPAIRAVARDHVAGRHRNAWINEVRARNHNPGPATPAEIDEVNRRLQVYLDSSDGRAEIESCTPAPLGRGQIDQRIKMPDPFEDATGFINWLSMDLGEGRINMLARAHAEVFCGSVKVELPMWMQPSIGANNKIMPGPITKGQPHSDVDTDILCDIAIVALSAFLLGPLIGSVVAIVGVSTAETLAENLVSSKILGLDLPAARVGGNTPRLPSGVRLKELLVQPTGLTIQGEWGGRLSDPHTFEPVVRLVPNSVTTPSRTFFFPEAVFEATCGGPPHTFRYKTHAWDTTIAYTIESRDVPLPLHFERWLLYHESLEHILTPGRMTFPGQVVVRTPPNGESKQPRDEIVIDVQGDDEHGYSLSFRGEDFAVPFSLYTRVIDGSGREWTLQTNGSSKGITFEFDESYAHFREECAQRIIEVVSRYQLSQEAPVIDTVTTIEDVVQDHLRGVVHGTNMGAAELVRQMMAERPEMFRQIIR